jgi:hypothetical protein
MPNGYFDPVSYEKIAMAYGQAKTYADYIPAELLETVDKIVQFQQVESEVELVNPFWNTYKTGSGASLFFGSSSVITAPIKAIAVLHQRIKASTATGGGGYASIDAYIEANNIRVPQAWATLSALAGDTITKGIIEGESLDYQDFDMTSYDLMTMDQYQAMTM